MVEFNIQIQDRFTSSLVAQSSGVIYLKKSGTNVGYSIDFIEQVKDKLQPKY